VSVGEAKKESKQTKEVWGVSGLGRKVIQNPGAFLANQILPENLLANQIWLIWCHSDDMVSF
jgi:hypothetical protein